MIDIEKRRNPFYLNQFKYSVLWDQRFNRKMSTNDGFSGLTGKVVQLQHLCDKEGGVKEPLLANWPNNSDDVYEIKGR